MEWNISSGKKKIIKLAVSIIAVYIGFRYFLSLFLPFLLAYFIAWILRPFAGFLHRKLHIPLIVGGGIGLLFFLIGAGAGIYYLGKILIYQISEFFRNFPIYQSFLQTQIEGICYGCDKFFRLPDGTVLQTFNSGMELLGNHIKTNFLPAVTQQTIRFAGALAVTVGTILITLVAVLLWIKDMEEYKNGLKKSRFYPRVHKITQQLSDTGIAYLKTQLIVMSLIAVLCVIALLIIKNPYALLIGIAIAIFDAFPVLGSGLILVPWILFQLLAKNFFNAAVLGTLFICCQLIRELLEPKLLGGKLGIPPIFSMMAMYIGVQLFGVPGFFLGPLGFVIVRALNVESNKEEKKKEEKRKS